MLRTSMQGIELVGYDIQPTALWVSPFADGYTWVHPTTTAATNIAATTREVLQTILSTTCNDMTARRISTFVGVDSRGRAYKTSYQAIATDASRWIYTRYSAMQFD